MKVEHEAFVVTAHPAGVFTPQETFADPPNVADRSNILGAFYAFFSGATLSAVGTSVATPPAQGANSCSSGIAHKVVWPDETQPTFLATDFEYAAQCSNRVTCVYSIGLCSCFTGYSNDNCDTQNAYAN